jgi:hypothetical protein
MKVIFFNSNYFNKPEEKLQLLKQVYFELKMQLQRPKFLQKEFQNQYLATFLGKFETFDLKFAALTDIKTSTSLLICCLSE